MIKIGLLQPGLFIFRGWENFSIVQFIVCWSGSEGPTPLRRETCNRGSWKKTGRTDKNR